MVQVLIIWEVLIRAAVGDLIELKARSLDTNVVTRLLALKPGKVIGLPDFEEIKEKCQVDIYHHLKVGSVIREYHNNLDGCGYVISVSNDIQEAVKKG